MANGNGHSKRGPIGEAWDRYHQTVCPMLPDSRVDIESMVRHSYYIGALAVWRALITNADNMSVIESELTDFLNELLRRQGL